MKKFILFLLFANATVICFSQKVDTTNPAIEKNYLQKSKNQKTAAWVLLGGGAVIDLIGLAVYPKQAGLLLTPSEKKKEKTSLWLFAAGTTTMLTSIPFFISGHINKKKAQVTINTQQFNQLKNSNLYTVNYPALTLKIKL